MWNVIVNDTLIRGSVELMWTQSPTISHKFINTESFLKCDSSKNHKMAHGAILWFFKESHLRKLWPSYDCYFEFGKSSEVQNKSQMRKLSWMPNVFLNPIQKKFLLKFFLTAFELSVSPRRAFDRLTCTPWILTTGICRNYTERRRATETPLAVIGPY